MMKGYLTVFLALSLSIFTSFILFLTLSAVKNGEKVRFESAADISMNAVLAEYHMDLFERYGLLYIDASYLGSVPSIENVERRLRLYIEKNTSDILGKENAPWGNISLKEVKISDIETAAAGVGASMRSQAIEYIEDTGIVREESKAAGFKEDFTSLDGSDPMAAWNGIMELLAGMELPLIQNEQGEWEEVPLSNPADWVYSLAGSDVLYLTELELQAINPISIDLESFISHRGVVNTADSDRTYRNDEEPFLNYLFEKMGCFGSFKEGSLLCCQIEYLAEGKGSDLENMKAVAERIFRWRFADNVELALSDGGLWEQALAAANELQAVALKTEFAGPVAESILYACAFIESISDVKILYMGGAVPLSKSTHQMSVEKVLSGAIYSGNSIGGLTYNQYLAGMLLLMDPPKLNLRVMDIMEMDLRHRKGKTGFCMDWCIERYEVLIIAGNGMTVPMKLHRKYGYF